MFYLCNVNTIRSKCMKVFLLIKYIIVYFSFIKIIMPH